MAIKVRQYCWNQYNDVCSAADGAGDAGDAGDAADHWSIDANVTVIHTVYMNN